MQVRLRIEPYCYSLIATDDRKTFSRLTGEDTIGSLGMCSTHKKDNSILVLGVFDDEVATLVHEIVHIVLRVFELCGVDPIASSGEPMAYLTDNLFTKISDALWVRPANRKKACG